MFSPTKRYALSMSTEIRQISEPDFEPLRQIYNQIVKSDQTLQRNTPFSESDFRNYLLGKSAAFCLLRDNRILGAYWLSPNSLGHGSHVANGTYIVDPNFRGKGLGSDLCEHSLAQASRLGFKAIQFNWVREDNYASRKLWERFGFSLIGTVPAGFRTDSGEFVNVCIYHRFLDSAEVV